MNRVQQLIFAAIAVITLPTASATSYKLLRGFSLMRSIQDILGAELRVMVQLAAADGIVCLTLVRSRVVTKLFAVYQNLLDWVVRVTSNGDSSLNNNNSLNNTHVQAFISLCLGLVFCFFVCFSVVCFCFVCSSLVLCLCVGFCSCFVLI